MADQITDGDVAAVQKIAGDLGTLATMLAKTMQQVQALQAEMTQLVKWAGDMQPYFNVQDQPPGAPS